MSSVYFATPMVTLINETSVSVVAVVGACRPSTHRIPSAGLSCISRISVAANDKNNESTLVQVLDVDDLSKSISFQEALVMRFLSMTKESLAVRVNVSAGDDQLSNPSSVGWEMGSLSCPSKGESCVTSWGA